MNTKGFIFGITLALIVLGFYCIQLVNSNRIALRTWKPAYEQICREDGNTIKDCLCAIAFLDQATPSDLSGEALYDQTKDLLKGVCL